MIDITDYLVPFFLPFRFAIWGPIYAGEALFVGTAILQSSQVINAALPSITAAFCAANVYQSLWCASFRPSYTTGDDGAWRKFVSVAMLGGTAICLSQVHAAAAATTSSWYFLPLTMYVFTHNTS